MGAAVLTLGALSCLSSCSKQEASPAPTASRSTQDVKKTPATQQELKDAWDNFLGKVEKGEWKDAFGQYVSKSTRVESDGDERASRPKKDATTREFKRITKRASNGDITMIMAPIDEPCPPDALECGGGGGGGYIPPSYTFITTEMVQPYGTPPTAARSKNQPAVTNSTNGFYSTENPQGFLYDLKIVKGTGAGEPTFDGSRYYHNIELDLNQGAGGEYIYVSFTRDPSAIIYQTNGFDERTYDYSTNPITQVHYPVTNVLTTSTSVGKPNTVLNGGEWTAMWAESPFPPVNSDYMKFPDLNDGAGGRYVYAYQSRRTNYGNPIELGVLASNSSSTPAPSGWTKVGGDLNEGAGGDYIYFCVKHR